MSRVFREMCGSKRSLGRDLGVFGIVQYFWIPDVAMYSIAPPVEYAHAFGGG
jgi:hypothetical protein